MIPINTTTQATRGPKSRMKYARRMLKRYLYRLPQCIKSGSLVQRKCHVFDDKKLIYQVMYKVASSSILASLYAMTDKPSDQRMHVAVLKAEKTELDIPYGAYPGYYRFTFVRNPLERLVSCYVNKYHSDKKKVESGELRHLYFHTYLMGYLRKDRGFAEFARRVARIPDRLADPHFVAQCFLTQDRKGRPLLDYIGRFEELPGAFDAISQQYGVPPLKTYNKTDKGNWMDHYDLETAERMIKHYRRDIELFGYEDEAEALLAYVKAKQ